jgi:hypothetical protein
MKNRLVVIGVCLMIVVVLARVVMGRAGSSGDVAVDTTGASAAGGVPSRATPLAGTTSAGATPGSTVSAGGSIVTTPPGPSPTGIVAEVNGTAVPIDHKPLLLVNPSTVRTGSSVGVTGSGFDPGATVDVFVKQQVSDTVDPLTFIQVDRTGGFGGVSFPVPDSLPRGNFVVEAQQRGSQNVARAAAVVAGSSPQIKFGAQAGKSGDEVQVSATDFSPDEDISIFWNGLSSDAIGTLHTDASGGLDQGTVRVPFGAVGNNAFVFIGDKSQSPVTVAFQLLNLYPNVDLSSYAIKPDNVLSFSGKGFGPDEKVTVYLNDPNAPPLTTIQTDASGAFANSAGLLVPFGLRGKQTLIFMGEESNAPTTASFDTLPYTPSAQPSTYGGRPGTTLTFYAIGFARSEIVHAIAGRSADSPGTEVSCFRTDAQGNAASGGSYVVPGDAEAGLLTFTLIGSKSQAAASAALEVIASDVPVQVPPQAPFQCDLVDAPDSPQVVGEAAPPETTAPPAQGPPAPGAANPPDASTAQAQPTAPAAASATPKPSPTATISATPKSSPTPKASATAKASPTPKTSPTAKASPTPKASPTAKASPTPKASPTAKRTGTPQPTPVGAPAAEATPATEVIPAASSAEATPATDVVPDPATAEPLPQPTTIPPQEAGA